MSLDNKHLDPFPSEWKLTSLTDFSSIPRFYKLSVNLFSYNVYIYEKAYVCYFDYRLNLFLFHIVGWLRNFDTQC